MARRTKAEAEQTRRAILDAAERLFYEQGVARTTLDEIARAAGVTRGAVYWHFSNKVDVFEAMHERVMLPAEELFARLEATTAAEARDTLAAVFETAFREIAQDDRRRRVYTILCVRCEYVEEMKRAEERLQRMHLSWMATMEGVFSRAEQAGLLASAWTARQAALCFHATFKGLFTDWLKSPGQSGLEDEIAVVRQLLGALFKPEAAPPCREPSSPH